MKQLLDDPVSKETGAAETRSANGLNRINEDLVQKICVLVGETVDVPPDALPICAETRLFGNGIGVDSIEVVKIVVALEEEFDIEIEDSELVLSSFESIESIASLVQGNITSS